MHLLMLSKISAWISLKNEYCYFTFISEDPFSDISQYSTSLYEVLQLVACELLQQVIKKVKLLLLLNGKHQFFHQENLPKFIVLNRTPAIKLSDDTVNTCYSINSI